MLPKWVISNQESVAREAADYISMTPAERAAILDLLCDDAEVLATSRPDAARVFAYRDPVPAKSKELFARLRAAYRAAQRTSA